MENDILNSFENLFKLRTENPGSRVYISLDDYTGPFANPTVKVSGFKPDGTEITFESKEKDFVSATAKVLAAWEAVTK